MGSTALLVAGIGAAVGGLASAGTALYQGEQQKKAARSAAAAADAAAQKAAVVQASDSAGEQRTTQAEAQGATQAAAKRRMSMQSTVRDGVAASGLRRTLG